MFSRLFKNDWPIQLIAILPFWIYIAILIFNYNSPAVPNYEMSHLYNFISFSLSSYPIISKIIILGLIIFQSIMISLMLQNHELIDNKSFAPSFVFIFLILIFPQHLSFSPIHFANTFLLLFLNKTLITFDEEKANSSLFTCALYASLSILFFFPTIVFIIPLWISLIIFSNFNIKSIIATIFGIIFPYVYIFTYYYVTDTLGNVLFFYGGFFNKTLSFSLPDSIEFRVILGFISLVLFAIITKLIVSSTEKLIRIRKKIQFLDFISFFALISIFLSSRMAIHQIGLIFIPFSFMFSIFYEDLKNKILVEIYWWIILILCLIGHIYFF